MDFGTARNLGLIGSILAIVSVVLGLIPWIGLLFSLLGLAGFILVLVSLYMFSKIYAEPRIFRDALISVIVGIAGLIVAILLLIILLGAAFASEVRSGFPAPPREAPPEVSIAAIFGTAIVFILVALAASAISAFFWYRALNTLSRVSGEGMFRTAGLLYAIGVLLAIISIFTWIILLGFLFILLSFIVVFVSWIVLALAFYNIKQPQQAPPQPAMPTAPA